MGMIDRIIGMGGTATAVGTAATNISEVFRENATRRMELDEEAYARAIAEHGAEFQMPRAGWFDGLVNGLNRLPRPLLTLGTIGLFGYAMVEPIGFSERMEGLALVPDPLWWLMGAIVSFYFGAREAHYFRHRVWPQATVRQTAVTPAAGGGAVATQVEARLPDALDEALAGAMAAEPVPMPEPAPAPAARGADRFADNAALADWAASRR